MWKINNSQNVYIFRIFSFRTIVDGAAATMTSKHETVWFSRYGALHVHRVIAECGRNIGWLDALWWAGAHWKDLKGNGIWTIGLWGIVM